MLSSRLKLKILSSMMGLAIFPRLRRMESGTFGGMLIKWFQLILTHWKQYMI